MRTHTDKIRALFAHYEGRDNSGVDWSYWQAARAQLDELEAQPSQTEAKPASFTEVATLALDLTEAIWPLVKGIEQYELTNLAERCIYKGMELRKKHVSVAQPSAPTVDQITDAIMDLPERDQYRDGRIDGRILAIAIRARLTQLLTNP